ncbi:MAG: magnesium chelatase subunit D [Pseudomonadota bacterium]
MEDDAHSAWARAGAAAAVFAVDPAGIGGLWLRARSGPARDRFLEQLSTLAPMRKIHPNIADAQLFGGLDLSATLSSGHRVQTAGVLGMGGVICLTMAERCPGGLAAKLGQAVDASTHGVVALDEGAEDDETAPGSLTERLGLFVALEGVGAHALSPPTTIADDIASARERLPSVSAGAAALEALTVLAAQLGITSLRAPLQAVAAARALAALAGREDVGPDDIRLAAELTFSHRATVFPEHAEPPTEEPEAPEAPRDTKDHAPGDEEMPPIPQEVLLEAVRSALPPGLLASLAAGRATRGRGAAAGSGAKRKGNRRGRPLPSRPGRLGGGAPVDLVATLRAAAPWQPMRRASAPAGHLLHIRPSDIRLKRYEERSDRLLIFTVDASGSSAMARLAEAKGAIELLLGEAYARRDYVALVAFRGTEGELLLPPTRSLVQTKRRLAALPGGGGTPLAAGLRTAFELAGQVRGRGMTPSLALLTDGRANIALDGRADRRAAGADAERLADAFRAEGLPALVIDTATRPQRGLESLAHRLGAAYLPMPRADAHGLSAAVTGALGG